MASTHQTGSGATPAENLPSKPECACPACCTFEIRVKGQLSELWAGWFDGLSIEACDTGESLLTGPIVDQAALMGVLNKLARLNLALVSVNVIEER